MATRREQYRGFECQTQKLVIGGVVLQIRKETFKFDSVIFPETGYENRQAISPTNQNHLTEILTEQRATFCLGKVTKKTVR